MEKQLLPHEDSDVSQELRKSLAADHVAIYTGTAVAGIEKSGDSVIAHLSSGEAIEAEQLLLAIGRRPAVQGLWKNVNIRMENNTVAVDEYMQTSVAGIYAIGDLVATPALAHVASHEGITAVRHIMNAKSCPMDYQAVPRCVYTSPQVAAVGLTENELRARGIDYRLGFFPFCGLGKAIVSGQTQGFVKLLIGKDDVIVGAQIVGDCAVELLAELTMSVKLHLTAEQIGELIHPHPSLSEALMEAALDACGASVHRV
jgi:dihydrolipoamide dehydrogenase